MGQPELVGAIYPKRGVIVIADTQILDEAWVTAQNAQSEFAVDFTGEGAEYFARRRSGQFPPTQLADGTWRLIVPGTDAAQIIGDESRQHASREGWLTSKITVTPKRCSKMRAQDATRESRFGMVGAKANAFAALRIEGYMFAELWVVKDVKGDVVELRIKLPVK